MDVVIGLATEIPHLKYGKIFSEFASDLLIHVVSNFDRGADLRPVIYSLDDPKPILAIKEPAYPTTIDDDGKEIQPTKAEEKKWDLKMKRHLEREDLLDSNLEKLFGLIMGQCTQGLMAELKAEKEYEIRAKTSDALWLLKKVKVISAGIDSRVNRIYTYHDKLTDMILLKQEALESIDDYRARFVAIVKTLEMTGGIDVFYPYKEECKGSDGKINATLVADMREKVMGMFFIQHADKIRFGFLIGKLKEQEALKSDAYPVSLLEAYNMLIRFEREADEDRVRRADRSGKGEYNSTKEEEEEDADTLVEEDIKVVAVEVEELVFRQEK